MNISMTGERPGETTDIDEEDMLPEYEKNEVFLGIETNKRNPNGFMFRIEDGDEVLSVRLTVDKVKFMIKHIVDDL